MILQRLNELYDRLLENPDPVTGEARVPPYGFKDENISYCLVLSKAGELVDIQDVRDTTEKKPKPKLFSVPRPPKKSINISPSFLWGNTQYVLGLSKKIFKNNDVKDYFFAFRDHINNVFCQTHDESLLALKNFLTQWESECFTSELVKPEHLDLNFVFKINGSIQFIHQLPEAQRLWMHAVQGSENAISGSQCLITGNKDQSIARLHDAVSGGYLKNYSSKAECSLVAFNLESFKSYEQDKGYCAPVSENAAFAYTTALSYLLRRENGQCILIGDTSTVFWARAKSAQEESQAVSFFRAFANPPSDEGQVKKLGFSLEKIAKGRPFEEVAPDLDPESRFYVLGLAPNAARLSVRFWLDSTLGELGERIAQHWRDILIDPLPWSEGKPPSVWTFLLQLTSRRKKPNGDWKERDAKKNPPSPHLSGVFFRSVISGTPYPISILTKLLDCIRSDGDVSGLRTALIKGVLVRNFPHQFTKEIPMALDKDHPSPAYQLGCQFALFERAQYAALGKLNASVKDKYFGTASASPRTVFAALHRNFSHHVADLRKGKKYEKWKGDPQILAGWLEKRTGEISNKLSTHYPAQLSLSEQGLFVLGYYHQRFVPKAKDTTLAAALKDESDEVEVVLETDQHTSD